MKNKVPVKVKASPAKSKKDSSIAVRAARPPIPKPVPKKVIKPMEDPRNQQAVRDYEQAVKFMQAQKFDKGKALLEKVVNAPIRELADRASVHLNICNQQLSKVTNTFKSPEEHYDYAISLMNMGDYVGCREHLEKLTNQHPKLDFVWYGRAVLDCLTGRFPEALQHLTESIRLNKNNRFQARNDSDFRNLADDPRFTELLYPEITG